MAHTKRHLKRNTKSNRIFINKTKKRSTRLSKRSKRTKSKAINLYKIEYPYYKQTVTKHDIIKHFKQLRKYKPQVLNYNPVRKPLNKLNNSYVVFVENYEKNKDLLHITDYFSQLCRVKCIYNTSKTKEENKKSILDIFTENRSQILQQLEKENKLTHFDLTEYLFNNYKMCTSFNTTIVVSILKHFKPQKFLDLSAGWGDRLVGAIAYGCHYTGVDPSECMYPIYKKIIHAFTNSDTKNNYKIIKSGFEDATLPENEYDLMFSSPPFFTLEIYENTKAQSVEKFNTLQKWLDGFLYPSIHKVHTSLKIGGHMALYVSDYTDTQYTEKMKKYIKDTIPGFKYVGDLHWINNEKRHIARTVFVWRKV